LVAEGRYGGATIEMKSGVDLFGGFDPADWTRDIDHHRSALDGEGARRVVAGADRARIDGVWIRGGRGRGNGAGVLGDGVAPVISNNIFLENSTTAPANWKPAQMHESANDGGAIAVLRGAAPVIERNLFARNTTEAGRGAAIACVKSSPAISLNVFLAN